MLLALSVIRPGGRELQFLLSNLIYTADLHYYGPGVQTIRTSDLRLSGVLTR